MGINVGGTTFATGGTANLTVNTSTAAQMLIVDSTSRIQKPSTPFMQSSSNWGADFYAGNPVPLTPVSNVGNCWNGTSFICPVAGKYICFMSGIASGSAHGRSSYGYYGILKNGSVVAYSHWNHTESWESTSLSAVIPAAVGDSISFCINVPPVTASGLTSGWIAANHSSFFIGLAR